MNFGFHLNLQARPTPQPWVAPVVVVPPSGDSIQGEGGEAIYGEGGEAIQGE